MDPRKAWVFIMSLSYSRYMYAAITLDQSVQTFIRCHTEAFRYFGGVPQTVKIDNLKAAIVETDFYEPTVQRTYAAFAKHYGFLPDSCRAYTPTDKGKVESNVKYVKDNCFKGLDFSDLQEARRFLAGWLSDTANRRKHGTTGKQPQKIFLETEKDKLGPLPAQDFIFSKSGCATVRTDCHIVHEGNFYSVPYAYIGMDVDVIEVNHLLKIYHAGKEIALHSLCEHAKGEHVTDKSHYPSTKNVSQQELLSGYRRKMAEVGNGAASFLESIKVIETGIYGAFWHPSNALSLFHFSFQGSSEYAFLIAADKVSASSASITLYSILIRLHSTLSLCPTVCFFHRPLPLSASISNQIADTPEHPVDRHGNPYPDQPQMKCIAEKIRRSDSEHPHGNNGNGHCPHYITCRAQRIGQRKGRHPCHHAHDRVVTNDL